MKFRLGFLIIGVITCQKQYFDHWVFDSFRVQRILKGHKCQNTHDQLLSQSPFQLWSLLQLASLWIADFPIWIHVNPAGLKSVINDNLCKAGETEKLLFKGAVQFPDVSFLFPAPITLLIPQSALTIISSLDQGEIQYNPQGARWIFWKQQQCVYCPVSLGHPCDW